MELYSSSSSKVLCDLWSKLSRTRKLMQQINGHVIFEGDLRHSRLHKNIRTVGEEGGDDF